MAQLEWAACFPISNLMPPQRQLPWIMLAPRCVIRTRFYIVAIRITARCVHERALTRGKGLDRLTLRFGTAANLVGRVGKTTQYGQRIRRRLLQEHRRNDQDLLTRVRLQHDAVACGDLVDDPAAGDEGRGWEVSRCGNLSLAGGRSPRAVAP